MATQSPPQLTIAATHLEALTQSNECLEGMLKPLSDAVKQCEGSTPLVYPDPPDKYDAWTNINYILATLQNISEYCAETLPHDEEYTWRGLGGKVQLLAPPSTNTATGTTTAIPAPLPAAEPEKPKETELEEARRCLNGLDIESAFKLAQGGTKYEPNAPEGDFDVWDEQRYIIAQLQSISDICDRSALTERALKSASLADRVSILIKENKSTESWLRDVEDCFKKLLPAIKKAHVLVDGSGTVQGEISQGDEDNDPDVVREMKYVVNELVLVDAELNRHKVTEIKGTNWEGLNLEFRVAAIARGVASSNGVAGGAVNGDETGPADKVQTALALVDVDAMERRQSHEKQMDRVIADLHRMKQDLNNAGVTNPAWREETMANKVEYVAGQSSKASEDDGFREKVKEIFMKLYGEIEGEKNERVKKGMEDILMRVLPKDGDAWNEKEKEKVPVVEEREELRGPI